MPKDTERYVADHTLLFANDDFSFSVQRFIKTSSTEGWYFFGGEERSIGTLIIIEQRPDSWYVHGSFTVNPDAERFWPYLIDFLSTINITSAFVTVHAEG